MHVLNRVSVMAMATLLLMAPSPAASQQTQETGTVAGKVVDDRGAPVGSAQIFIGGTQIAGQTRADGGYTLARVPTGTQVVRARMLGFRPDSASVTVAAGRDGHPGLHPQPRSAAAADPGRDRHPVAPDEPRRQRRRHDADRPGGGAGGAAEHHRDAPLRPRLHPGGELGR